MAMEESMQEEEEKKTAQPKSGGYQQAIDTACQDLLAQSNRLRQNEDGRPSLDRASATHSVPDRYANFRWPVGVPLQAKVEYVKKIGKLTLEHKPDEVARYLITWEHLNLPQHTSEMIELVFANDSIVMETDTRINFAFCDTYIDAKSLKDTPFGELSETEYGSRIKRLTLFHEENVRLFRQMEALKTARATGRPVPSLYTPPSLDDDAAGREELKEKPHQMLLEFLFDRAGSQHLRRTDTCVYACQRTRDRQNTRCYVYDMDIAPWIVRQVTPKHLYLQQYSAYTDHRGTPAMMADHIGHTPDPRFPFLTRCRTLFSFENGIFDAHSKTFHLYETSETPITGVHTVSELDPHVSTAKYFDKVIPLDWFKEGFDYRTIPVPDHEKIFLTQLYEPDDIDWVEGMCGRLQHNVGSLEDWQIALFFEGPGKTGKSVFLKLVALWYLTMDVGLIGDDVEQTFADQHLLGKFIVMCMDISADFGLTPTRFLSWVSGEWLSVMRKFKEAIAIQWTAPILFASNSPPPIATSGGAGPRRWIIMMIEHAVGNSDGKLFKRAQDEIAFFIIKCAFSYHDKVDKHGGKGLWDSRDILPKRFWAAREAYTIASSWPDAYLHSDLFEFSPGYSVDESDFIRQYAMFRERKKTLQGVSNKRGVKLVQCNPMEFANALNDYPTPPGVAKPKWNTETKRINGLKFIDREASAVLPAVEPAPPRRH